MTTVKSPRRRAAPPPADLRTRLVDEAGRIMLSDGAAALTLRGLAAACGTSTMAVYTLFGDKQGLLAAMYRQGFERLGVAMRSVRRTARPLHDLVNLGLAYRKAALANPHLYDLMFGRPVPGFAPDEATKGTAEAAYRPLVDGVQRCLDAGDLVGADAEEIALYLWAVAHGVVSLELAGHVPGTRAEQKARYETAILRAGIPFLPAGG